MPRWTAGIALALLAATAAGAAAAEPVLRVTCHGNHLVAKAADQPLAELLRQIGMHCRVAVSGLQRLPDRSVSFEADGEPVAAIRRLLRRVRVANVAMVYDSGGLRQVVILPAGQTATRRTPPPAPPTPPAASADAVEVDQVIAGTQADALGLQPGDLIVAYDHRRIRRPGDLIRLSRGTASKQPVVLTVLRNGDEIQYAATGGFIGVRIRQVKIFASELDALGLD